MKILICTFLFTFLIILQLFGHPHPDTFRFPRQVLISLGHLGSIAAYLFSQTHKAIPIFLKGGSVYYTGFFFPITGQIIFMTGLIICILGS